MAGVGVKALRRYNKRASDGPCWPWYRLQGGEAYGSRPDPEGITPGASWGRPVQGALWHPKGTRKSSNGVYCTERGRVGAGRT